MRWIILPVVVMLCGCTQDTGEEVTEMGELSLSSPAFEDNAMMPGKYTCDGDDVNPPMRVDGVPEGAKSLVLIVDDPDAPAGVWDHWVVWNIPADTREIPEDSVPGTEGTNDFRKTSYGGPCPPSGTHRYRFKLYAVDAKLELDSTARKKDVEKAMEDHILAQTQLTGLYKRT